MKKNDWIIIGIIIVIAGGVYLWNNFQTQKAQSQQKVVEVFFDGEIYDHVNINEDKTIVVQTDIGKNVIEIKQGKVTMVEADCPDKICLKTGTIELANRSIVCLPNKVHVEIIGESEDEIDAIVQ